MLPHEFQGQMKRLEETFTVRAFPANRVELIWKQVSDMDIAWFTHLCDRMVGDMRQPPLVPDFREAAYKERQARFGREVDSASRSWDTGEFNGLQAYLRSVGAINLKNAVEQERWRIRNGQDDFPDGASPRVVHEASTYAPTEHLPHAERTRQLASMIKDLNEVVK